MFSFQSLNMKHFRNLYAKFEMNIGTVLTHISIQKPENKRNIFVLNKGGKKEKTFKGVVLFCTCGLEVF